MAAEQLTLPTDENVHLVYLRKWPNLGDMIYLQAVRSSRMKEDSSAAQSYKAMAFNYARQLADLLKHEIPEFDTVVSPPSKRMDADVYRNEILRRVSARDLTPRFSRRGAISAAASSSVQEVINEFGYQPAGDESEIKSLVIVDESVASGRTIAAALYHLRKAGLTKDCTIFVATAAWLVEKKSEQAPASGSK
jgi:hypothetical protein